MTGITKRLRDSIAYDVIELKRLRAELEKATTAIGDMLSAQHRAEVELERLRAELEDYRWLCTVPLAIDTTGDPDNFVHIWVGSPEKRYSGRTVVEAIREARKHHD